MLPKPDKNKKSLDSENTPREIDPILLAKKAKKKRRLIVISLVLTVGISLIFWTYHFLKNNFTGFSFPKINTNLHFDLPAFTPKNKNKYISFEENIQKIIPSSDASWSFFVSQLPLSNPLWQKNFSDQNLDNIVQKISSISATTQSQFDPNLPQGLTLQEFVSESTTLDYQSIITTPTQKILIIIQNNNKDINSTKSLLPKLINQLYWDAIQSIN